MKFKSTSWNSKVRVTSSNTGVTSSNLRVMSSNAGVASSNARVASSNPGIIKSMKAQVNSLKSSWFSEIISPKLFVNSWGNSFVQFLVIICLRFSLFYGHGFSRKLSKLTLTLNEEIEIFYRKVTLPRLFWRNLLFPFLLI